MLFSGPRGGFVILVLLQVNGTCPALLGEVVSGRSLPSNHRLLHGGGGPGRLPAFKYILTPQPSSQHSTPRVHDVNSGQVVR